MKVLDYERDFILDPSLALYLPLWKKDGSVIASEDRHGHSCTVTGPVWRPQGRAFDGTDDYIAISHNAGIALGAAISIVGWVYSTEIVGHSSLQYVIADKSTWPDAGWTFFVINQKLKLQTLDGSAHGATGASIFPCWSH
jgi:hypothetical protein